MKADRSILDAPGASAPAAGKPEGGRYIPAQDRHFQDFGWLKTFWLFSFASYHDPDNVNHGILRVVNDDI